MHLPSRENDSAYPTASRSPSGPSTREQPLEPAESTGLAMTGYLSESAEAAASSAEEKMWSSGQLKPLSRRKER